MTALLGIVRKELKVSFTTPVAYVVFFLFTLLVSMLFWGQLREFERMVQKMRHISDPEMLAQLNFNDVVLAEVFVNIQVIFIFLIPILTMKVIAEEKKQKTMELLMTTPISTATVLFGKYIAVIVILLCLCLLLLIYPVILSVYGTNAMVQMSVVDWRTTLMGIIGIFLSGMMFSSLGFVFSSVTENQIVSALLTFFSLLLLWFIGGTSINIHGWLADLLTYLSPLSHVKNFAKGVLDLGDVTYYFSVTGILLFLSHRMVEGQRWG
jgi:ABC-2 type transport system permease protein